MEITQLPTELIVEIFNKVSYIDLVNLSKTCTKFYDIIKEFSWKQLCVIKKLVIPANIKFVNCMFYFEKMSDALLINFCTNMVFNMKLLNTVVIGNACANKIFFDYLQKTTCKNVVLLKGVYEYRNIEEYCGIFNFCIVGKNYSSRSFELEQYDLKTHMKLFNNANEFNLICKTDGFVQVSRQSNKSNDRKKREKIDDMKRYTTLIHNPKLTYITTDISNLYTNSRDNIMYNTVRNSNFIMNAKLSDRYFYY